MPSVGAPAVAVVNQGSDDEYGGGELECGVTVAVLAVGRSVVAGHSWITRCWSLRRSMMMRLPG